MEHIGKQALARLLTQLPSAVSQVEGGADPATVAEGLWEDVKQVITEATAEARRNEVEGFQRFIAGPPEPSGEP